jgi:predicted permease
MVLSTFAGLAWAIAGWPIPLPIAAYLNIFAAALTPCALFAIGLGLSGESLRSKLGPSIALTLVKLVLMPLVVYGLCLALGLNPLYTIAAVVCAAVPTAKTVFILAGEYKVEEELVTATISLTTLLSVVTLLGWLYAVAGLSAQVQKAAQAYPGRHPMGDGPYATIAAGRWRAEHERRAHVGVAQADLRRQGRLAQRSS